MQKRVHYICVFLCGILLLLSSTTSYAQQQDTTTQPGAGQLLEFLKADRNNIKKVDSNQFISYAGNVKIKQGKTLFYADSAVVNPVTNIFEAFGNIHINDEIGRAHV